MQEVWEQMVKQFEQWGVPQMVKVDHGRPLGDPTRLIIPPLALWMIGMGIKVIYIRPATPTDNSKVERMQGVTANWAEPNKCRSVTHLQQQLDLAIDIQRNHYPSKSCGKISRIKAFPKLIEGGRVLQTDQFNLKSIYQVLQDKVWTRKVSKVGQINLFGSPKSVGTKFKQQQVNIQLDLKTESFCVSDHNKQMIKTFPANLIIEKWLAPLFQLQRTSSQ